MFSSSAHVLYLCRSSSNNCYFFFIYINWLCSRLFLLEERFLIKFPYRQKRGIYLLEQELYYQTNIWLPFLYFLENFLQFIMNETTVIIRSNIITTFPELPSFLHILPFIILRSPFMTLMTSSFLTGTDVLNKRIRWHEIHFYKEIKNVSLDLSSQNGTLNAWNI